MAGTMAGLATEISRSSANLVIEAAHFSARGTARMSRRHRLFSEASYRFEREVDRELPVRASARTAALLASLGGATVVPGCTHAQVEVPPVTISLPVDYPGRVAGLSYPKATVIGRLRDVGCAATGPGEDGGPAGGGGAAGGSGAGGPGAGGGPAGLTAVPPACRPDPPDPARRGGAA